MFGGAAGEHVRGPAEARGNLGLPLAAFADPATLDFRLRETTNGSPGAVPLTGTRPPDLVPEFEYAHPAAARVRAPASRDLPGAFGSCGGSGS